MLNRFIAAAQSGDFNAIKSMFAPDAQMTSDGGGKAVAVIRPLHGAERIARLWWALSRRREAPDIERRLVAHRLRWVAFVDRGVIHAEGTRGERRAVLAEPTDQEVRRQLGEIADGLDPVLG